MLSVMVVAAEAILALSPALSILAVNRRLAVNSLHMTLKIRLTSYRSRSSGLVDAVRQVAVVPFF